jgi:hypothetical protein
MVFSFVMLQAQTIVHSDNFDSYTAGQQLCSQNSTNWTTWSNSPGSTEDAYITTEQASSGSNSLKVTTGNDIIYPLSNQISGVFDIEFKYYIPATGNGAYFNLQKSSNLGMEWAFDCYFYNNGNGYFKVNNNNTDFSYPSNAWFPIKIHVNLYDTLATLTIDNTEIITWTFSQSTISTDGVNQLGAINFYSSAPNNASGTYYVDDFVYSQIGNFTYAPEGDIHLNVEPNDTRTYTLNMSNSGNAPINYRIVPVYDVTAGPDQEEITLSYATETSVGTSVSSPSFAAAIGFPASEIASRNLIGKSLNRIEADLFNTSNALDAKIQIYDMNGTVVMGPDEMVFRVPGPGEVVYEQSFTPTDGLNSITLTTPYLLDGRDLWIGICFESTGSPGEYANVGCCSAYSPNVYGNWYKSSSAWTQLSTNHLGNGSWIITGYVDGTAITPWISVAPSTQGTIAANGSAQADITFHAGDDGTTRTGKLYLYSDDLSNAVNILNVTIMAFEGADIEENSAIRISIFPNPATDVLNIASESINRVEVFNMAGQRVWDGQYSENEITIATHNWAPGTYMVKVTANGTAKVEKIIVR